MAKLEREEIPDLDINVIFICKGCGAYNTVRVNEKYPAVCYFCMKLEGFRRKRLNAYI
jgi:hypothetical protein